jgi:hypothetical protein
MREKDERKRCSAVREEKKRERRREETKRDESTRKGVNLTTFDNS